MEKSKYFDEEYFLQGTPDVIKHFNDIYEDRENSKKRNQRMC